MIDLFYSLINEARQVKSTIRLSDFFLRTDIVQRIDNYDSFIRGLLSQIAQEQDQYYTSEVCLMVIPIVLKKLISRLWI